MATIKTGDFIELDYTGKLEDGTIFDTTRREDAMTGRLDQKAAYKPAIICIGEGQLLPGLDEYLTGKTLGAHSCSLPAEKAFGKKDAKLLKLIPLQKFKEANIQPVQGLPLNIDGHYGVVRTISGGRVTVDFNHPLAGKDVTYDVDVTRVVTDPAVQVAAILDMAALHHHGVTIEGEGHVVITVDHALPQPLAESLNTLITKLTKLHTVSYHVEAHHHGGAASDHPHH